MGFADDYVSVAERLAEFRDKYPEGALQPSDRKRPYHIERIGDQIFIVYVAAAYRVPGDPRPGIGVAWEPFPGKTSFTRDSELMNAETSAWGRAIVAALAADTKRGTSSAEEARNRQGASPPNILRDDIIAAARRAGVVGAQQLSDDYALTHGGAPIRDADESALRNYLGDLRARRPAHVPAEQMYAAQGDAEKAKRETAEHRALTRDVLDSKSDGRARPGVKQAERSTGRTEDEWTAAGPS
jgi:hypothetical protein